MRLRSGTRKNPRRFCTNYGGGRNPDPTNIANYDFVLTTYHLLISPKEKNEHNSPLSQLDWWRVVLDETHTIKAGNTQQAKECAKLKAVNRWCITGTPLNTDIKDLKAQLSFLGFKDPISNKTWWDRSGR